MKSEIINLREKPTEHNFMPTLTTYLIDRLDEDYPRPAMIVCPGGGYREVSPREAERIALNYNAAGFQAFVLDYCVAPHRHPDPIRDVADAIRLVRKNADEWNINPDQIAVSGFSAGGHLAASISVHWDNPDIFSEEEIRSELHKPNASVLAYPVIMWGEFANRGSFMKLLGEDATDEELNMMSLEKQVKPSTAPAFLWHTYEDTAVPVENTLYYAAALSKYNIPCEVHIYPKGVHGLSLVSDETVWCIPRFRRKYDWVAQSQEWLVDLFGMKLHPRN